MFSKYLPHSWKDSQSIAIMAGQGGKDSYPWLMASAAIKSGIPVKLVSFKGETSPELEALFAPKDVARVAIGDMGGLLNALKKLGASGAVMAGRVSPGHVLKGVFPDLRAMSIWASLKEKSAEAILKAIADEIQKDNIEVLDARIFMDGLMAGKDTMSKGKEPLKEGDVSHAIRIAEAVADQDIGQSIVTRKGTVLAVEAFEGTDAMIARAGQYREGNKIFVKTVKKNQDWRFDVPILGPKTLESIIAAHIGTVVLKAEGVIMVQKEEILKEAYLNKITVLGY
jgi:DUF1009 family protein